MIKRKLLNTLYKGSGSQLLYLAIFCVAILGLLTLISYLAFHDGTLVWQDVVALFLDPGVFAGHSHHDIFRLIVALAGVFTFSSVLVSLFTNIITNLADAFKNGEIHLAYRNHVLIIGAGAQLDAMLREILLDDTKDNVVVMTDKGIPEIRINLEHDLGSRRVRDRVSFLKGDETRDRDISPCYPWRASVIYVLGDPGHDDHDSRNIRCAEILSEMCKKSKKDIKCFVMLENDLSNDVFRYVTQRPDASPLKTDFIPASEYMAEQLLAHTDFLPAIKAGEDKYSHIVVLGKSNMAKAVAFISAHVSHYPNFSEGRNRTVISIMAPEIKDFMESTVLSKSSLFELCHWTYISESSREEHAPSHEMGDYLDIEFQFIDSCPESFFATGLIDEWSKDERQLLSFISASDSIDESVNWILSLSRRIHSNRMAVYLPYDSGILDVASQTGMFGNITAFGPAASFADALCIKRSQRGQRVNYLYDKAYNNPPSASAEEAWYKIPEAHKFSSVYCADAMPLRKRSFDFDGDRAPIYEAEHRRWMTSVLLMGYSALPLKDSAKVRADRALFKSMKAKFIHADITPFDMLSEEEQGKDALLMDSIDEILN